MIRSSQETANNKTFLQSLEEGKRMLERRKTRKTLRFSPYALQFLLLIVFFFDQLRSYFYCTKT